MRLIDADVLRDELDVDRNFDCNKCQNRYEECTGDGNRYYTLYDICEAIDNQPIVDAKPVVHAQWKYSLCCEDGRKFYCSNCDALSQHDTDYCPHCGAKMDGNDVPVASCKYCKHSRKAEIPHTRYCKELRRIVLVNDICTMFDRGINETD